MPPAANAFMGRPVGETLLEFIGCVCLTAINAVAACQEPFPFKPASGGGGGGGGGLREARLMMARGQRAAEMRARVTGMNDDDGEHEGSEGRIM